jgi:hypothetical protein
MSTRFVRRMPALLASAGLIAAIGVPVVSGSPGGRSLEKTLDAGWNCDPLILIGGHYHCSPPGRPGVGDIIAGTTVPTIEHQVFRADGTFAGTEILIRADLFADQPCPQDEWLPVPSADNVQYWACHRFDF